MRVLKVQYINYSESVRNFELMQGMEFDFVSYGDACMTIVTAEDIYADLCDDYPETAGLWLREVREAWEFHVGSGTPFINMEG